MASQDRCASHTWAHSPIGTLILNAWGTPRWAGCDSSACVLCVPAIGPWALPFVDTRCEPQVHAHFRPAETHSPPGPDAALSCRSWGECLVGPKTRSSNECPWVLVDIFFSEARLRVDFERTRDSVNLFDGSSRRTAKYQHGTRARGKFRCRSVRTFMHCSDRGTSMQWALS